MAWQNLLLSPNIKPANKPKTPQAFYRFAWEQPTEDELRKKVQEYTVTPQEIEGLNRIFAEIERKK